MKISKRDRIEALRWNPAYLKDLKKWEANAEQIRSAHLRGQIPGIDLATETKAFLELDKETRDKWGILHFSGHVDDQVVFADEVAVAPIGLTGDMNGKIYFEKIEEGDEPLEYKIVYQPDEKGITDFKDVYETGRHIYLRIDVTKTDDEIEKGVKRAIRFYKKLLPKKRNKEGMLDHWKVYDMVHKEGLTLPQIAEKDYGGNEDFDDPGYRAAYARVERAYNKALQIIKQVNQ